MKKHFPEWRYDAEAYYLSCLFHDIGTAERYLATTKLSFEFKGGLVAREFILEHGGEEDLADALSPVYDQLSLARGWWVLELLLTRHRVQRAGGHWEVEVYANMGRAREIPRQKAHPVYVHRSMKMRMEAERARGGVYEPRARFEGEPTWVA